MKHSFIEQLLVLISLISFCIITRMCWMCGWLPESPRRWVGKIKLLTITLLQVFFKCSMLTSCSFNISMSPCLYMCVPFHIKVHLSLALNRQTCQVVMKLYLWDEWTWMGFKWIRTFFKSRIFAMYQLKNHCKLVLVTML